MGNYENDRAFEAVLQNTGQNIEQFIDDFFSFLARRSDFFVETPPEGGRVGFPAGVARKLINSKYAKWEQFGLSRKQWDGRKPQTSTTSATVWDGEFRPDVGSNLEVGSEVEVGDSVIRPPESTASKEKKSPIASPSDNAKTEAKKSEKKSEPVGLCDTYNGKKTDKYSWSQSIKELDVYIKVEKDVQTKKQVKVEIHMNKIRVVTGTGGSADEVVTDWQLSHPIVKDESYWSLHPGESIFLSLQKVREMWWDHLFEGEEPIDRTKIEAVRPMEDLEDEEHAKIEELVWNQEQKLKGLPTSDELKMQEVMKKAWDAEGSPFKGQPFDMSRIQLNSNTVNIPPS